jgi:ProP effector
MTIVRPPSGFKRQHAAQLAGATIARLAKRFPACFHVYEARRRPLAIGIRQHLRHALASEILPAELSLALRRYTGSVGYLRNMRRGAPRIDIDGQTAGVVTADEAQHAKDQLAIMKQKRAERILAPASAPAPAPASASAPAPQPKRSSLADLREAGRRRREGGGNAA